MVTITRDFIKSYVYVSSTLHSTDVTSKTVRVQFQEEGEVDGYWLDRNGEDLFQEECEEWAKRKWREFNLGTPVKT